MCIAHVFVSAVHACINDRASSRCLRFLFLSSGIDVDEDLESGFAESMDQQGMCTYRTTANAHTCRYS